MQPGFLQTGNLVASIKNRHKGSIIPKNEEDVMIAEDAKAEMKNRVQTDGFGDVLRQAREAGGMTQQELAQRLLGCRRKRYSHKTITNKRLARVGNYSITDRYESLHLCV